MPTVAELGAKVRTKYPGAYDHLDDLALGRKVKAKYPQYAHYEDADSAAAQPQVMPGAGAAAVAPTAGLSSMVPGAMGMLGSLVPGPAGVAASGGLQALGEFGRQAVTGPPGIENPRGIAEQGTVGAGGALMGGVVGKGIGAIARTGMAIGGRVNPQIARTLMKHGINVGEGVFGAKKLAKVKGRAVETADNLYKAADSNTGANIPIKPMADAVRRLGAKAGTSRTDRGLYNRVAARIEKDYASHVTPSELRGIKQKFQSMLNYDSKQRTMGPIRREVAQVMSREARGNLVGLPKFGKRIADADEKIGQLRDAEQALRKSAKRVPGGNIGSLSYLTGILDHPTAYSSLALLLNSLGKPANLAGRALGSAAFPPGIAEEE